MMATYLAGKGAAEVVQRRWLVPVDSDDGPSGVSLSASGVTVDDNAFEGDELVLTLSAGSAGTTGTITATVTTSRGRTLVETIYIPVIAPGAAADTANEIISFALRKVTGIADTPDAEQARDALERLSDMIEEWRAAGADIGATRPLSTSTVIYAPQSYMSAIKNNLILRLIDIYPNYEPSPLLMRQAMAGLAAIKQANLSDARKDAYY